MNSDTKGWILPADKVNELQTESLNALIKRAKQAHFVNVKVRINGQWEEYEADWIKHMQLTELAAPMPPSAEGKYGVLWDRFIAHLNATSGYDNKNFLGSRDAYRSLFIEANRAAALASTEQMMEALRVERQRYYDSHD